MVGVFRRYVKRFLSGSAVAAAVVLAYATWSGHLPVNFWIFRCAADGYGSDTYLSYCGDPAYGDYEHLALYHALEPRAVEHLKSAEVLFLGNSRAKAAFNTEVVEAYFRSKAVSYYNLGFGYGEYDVFPRKLIEKHGLRPRMVVANTDYFFLNAASKPARDALQVDFAGPLHRLKGAVQVIHRRYCADVGASPFGWLCGTSAAEYRSVVNGRVMERGVSYDRRLPAAEAENRTRVDLARIEASAQAFKALLDERGTCLVLTVVPHSQTDFSVAQSLSASLGIPFVKIPVTGYHTYDGNHMPPESAEPWSAKFLAELEPVLENCVAGRAP